MRSRSTSAIISFLVLVLTTAGAIALTASPVLAQDDDNRFEDLFSSYLGDNAEAYLGPMATILGASLNSGLTRGAAIPGGFRLRLDGIVANSLIGDAQRTFQATTEMGFSPETTTEAPTIVGSGDPKVVPGDGGTAFVFPAGLDLERIGVVIPQVTVGSVLGTEATVRWLAYSIEDVGDFSLLGIGGRHSVSQYFPGLPLDLAVGVFYHTVEFADVVDISAVLASVGASVTRSIFTFYGGLGFETSSMQIAYDSHRAEGGRVELDLEGVQGLRGTAGLSLGLSVLSVFADLSAGSQTVFTLGFGLGR